MGLDRRPFDMAQLDITSYMPTPNHIYTCDEYVRTVYHIFTDLSDMDWQQKLTSFYNLVWLIWKNCGIL
jgi:hypothetical protein